MKKLFVLIALVCALFLLMTPAKSEACFGCGWVEAGGEGCIAVSSFDISSCLTGAAGVGEGGGFFNAEGPCIAGGSLDLCGISISNSFQGCNFANAWNMTALGGCADAYGLFSETGVGFWAQNGTSAGVMSPNTLAMAGNSASAMAGSYDFSLFCSESCAGVMVAGYSQASQYNTCISSGASALTKNIAVACGDCSWTSVEGGVLAMAERGSCLGYAGGVGFASYQASGPHFSAGKAWTNVDVKHFTTGNVTFSSVHVDSHARGFGG